MKYRSLFFSCLFLFMAVMGFSQEPYDLVIENAKIVDGTGAPAYTAQIVVHEGIIKAIEKDTTEHILAQKYLNAAGKVVSPGFIDTHAHGNPLKTPQFKNFMAMGVTTICLGQDGGSPMMADLRPWMKKVESKNPGVNIAMFVGHNSLRKLSGTNYDSVPTTENLSEMKSLLKRGMEAGAFGLTTGLEYNPGYFAQINELEELAKVVGKQGGLVMSHMRNEDNAAVENSINELLQQGAYSPVHISHLKVVYGKGEERAKEILKIIDSARAEGIQLTADIYPYSASYTGIGILFPKWAKKPNDYETVLKNRKAELAQFLREKVTKRNGPEATLLGSGPYKGKTLAEVSKQLNKPFEMVLIEDIGPNGASGAYFVMDKVLQQKLLTHPIINVCSDGSPTMNHPRGYGSFAKIIESFVVGEGIFTLEEAVQKMTGRPAKLLGLEKRGLIKSGYVADILIFDPEKVAANATYENPHQLATGFNTVIVNGKVAKMNENYTIQGFGKVLKHKE